MLHLLDLELNQARRSIMVCIRPTHVEDLYLLAVIAHPQIRRDIIICLSGNNQTVK